MTTRTYYTVMVWIQSIDAPKGNWFICYDPHEPYQTEDKKAAEAFRDKLQSDFIEEDGIYKVARIELEE